MRQWILTRIGGIQFELRDTHDYRVSVTNNAHNEPPTSVIYLKVRILNAAWLRCISLQ